MMYRTEKQLTTKQNKKIYEEVYFENDFSLKNYQDTSGFLLTYPNKFSQNPSQDKSIGIRRINVNPGCHFLYLAVEFYDGQNRITTPLHRGEYQNNNTMQEILVDLTNNLQVKDQQNNEYTLNTEYKPDEGKLNIYAVKYPANQAQGQQIQFRFVCFGYDRYLRLWGILNQLSEVPFNGYLQDNNYDEDSLIFVDSYNFTNVWNRTPLYFHASFSDSKYHYVCKTNDYWEKPAKLFYDNINGLEFTVYFTTDGVHKIIPNWSNILLELSFILRTQDL